MKRRSYTAEFKLEVVEFAKTHSGEATARKFGIDSKRVRVWKSQEDLLTALVQTNQNGPQQKRLRNLRGVLPEPRSSSGTQAEELSEEPESDMMTANEEIEQNGADLPIQTEALLEDNTGIKLRLQRRCYEAEQKLQPSANNTRRRRVETKSRDTESEEFRNKPSNSACCANCKSTYIPGEINFEPITEFTTHDTASGVEKQITVKEAIQTIFEAGLKLNKKSMTRSNDLSMCFQCISFLAELYRFYVEFMELTKFESIFQKLISKSIMWDFTKNQPSSQLPAYDNSEETDTLKLSDVKVEFEPDGLPYESDPGFDPDSYSGASLSPSQSQPMSEDDNDQDFRLHSSKGGSSETSVMTRSMLRGGRNSKMSKTAVNSTQRKVKSSVRRVHKLKLNPRNTLVKLLFKCTKCSKGFKDGNKLSLHITNHHSATRHHCTNCEKSFKEKKLLNRHLKFKHGENPALQNCTKCSKSFELPYQLRAHLRQAHGEAASVECSLCSIKFSTNSSLRTHFKSEHPNEVLVIPASDTVKLKILKCKFCSKIFETRNLLDSHVTAEHPEGRYQCPQCPKSFRTGKLFRRHLRFKHGDGSESLEVHACSICSKSFPIPSQLKTHMKSVHAEAKPFPCPQCDKMFPTKNYVACHIYRCHTDKTKQFKCEYCDKVYNSVSGYQIHVDTKHLNKKDFVCETCGKRFVTQNCLRKHLQTHDLTRTREFKCSECEQTFYTQHILNCHLKTHTGLKQHLCPHCGTEFLHAVSLRRHIQVRHVDEVEGIIVQSHKCEQCEKVFKLREYLLQHLRSRTHGGKGHTSERKKIRGSQNSNTNTVKRKSNQELSSTDLESGRIKIFNNDSVASFLLQPSLPTISHPDSTPNWYSTFYTS